MLETHRMVAMRGITHDPAFPRRRAPPLIATGVCRKSSRRSWRGLSSHKTDESQQDAPFVYAVGCLITLSTIRTFRSNSGSVSPSSRHMTSRGTCTVWALSPMLGVGVSLTN